MNTSNLKDQGFTDFILLQDLTFSSLPSNKGAVLVLADNTQSGKPTSDILYIGKSKKLPKRVFGGYLGGYGGKATRKINSKISSEGYMEKVTIGWMVSDNPKQAQRQMLDEFSKEHGDFPPWNSPKKTATNAATAVVKNTQKRVVRKPTSKRP